jgi:hypothetical protein
MDSCAWAPPAGIVVANIHRAVCTGWPVEIVFQGTTGNRPRRHSRIPATDHDKDPTLAATLDPAIPRLPNARCAIFTTEFVNAPPSCPRRAAGGRFEPSPTVAGIA